MRIAWPSRRRRRWLAVAIVLAGLCLAYRQRVPLLCGLGRWLNVGERLEQPVDAAMVLGGGASTRPFVAVEMVRAGLASTILMHKVEQTGATLDGLAPEEQDVTRQIVLKLGIAPDAAVHLTEVVGSTEDEARQAAFWLQAHPGLRLAVVTSDYHTRRARVVFCRACGSDARRLVFIGAPTEGFDACDWWRSESGLISYLTEYLKLVRTLVR